MEQILEAADLDEEQEKKLERELGRDYHLITRDERLETIAEDLVQHFMGRGYQGKAMVVSVDKPDRGPHVRQGAGSVEAALDSLKTEIQAAEGERRDELLDRITFMERTDMAVVVSQSQNEIDDFKKKGLDIRPHRKRMVEEDLETRFKDPDDPLRIVFVCSMWMTGFDAPHCIDGLPRQADEEPHAHADDRTGESGVRRKAGWFDRRLRGRLPEPAEGPGHLWHRWQRRW